MAASYTYTSLVTALQTVTEEYGDEYLVAIGSVIIPQAESRIIRELNIEEFTDIGIVNIDPGDYYIGILSDTNDGQTSLYEIDGVSITSVATGARVHLEKRSYEFIKAYWPTSSMQGTPKYYCLRPTTVASTVRNLLIAPAVSGVTGSILEFTTKIRPLSENLSASNPTTWISIHLADVLLYACLIESERYLKADERIAVWKDAYTEAIAAAAKELSVHMIHNTYILK